MVSRAGVVLRGMVWFGVVYDATGMVSRMSVSTVAAETNKSLWLASSDP
jgi:hypothetical protein